MAAGSFMCACEMRSFTGSDRHSLRNRRSCGVHPAAVMRSTTVRIDASRERLDANERARLQQRGGVDRRGAAAARAQVLACTQRSNLHHGGAGPRAIRAQPGPRFHTSASRATSQSRTCPGARCRRSISALTGRPPKQDDGPTVLLRLGHEVDVIGGRQLGEVYVVDGRDQRSRELPRLPTNCVMASQFPLGGIPLSEPIVSATSSYPLPGAPRLNGGGRGYEAGRHWRNALRPHEKEVSRWRSVR